MLQPTTYQYDDGRSPARFLGWGDCADGTSVVGPRFRTTPQDYEKGLKLDLKQLIQEGEFSPKDATYLLDVCDLMLDLHRGQYRHDQRTPFALHAFSVMRVAFLHGVRDANALAAYLLHDAAEEYKKHTGLAEVERWKEGLEFLKAHPLLQGERNEVFEIVDIMTMRKSSQAVTKEQRAQEDRKPYLQQFRGPGRAKAKAWLGKQFDMIANLSDLTALDPNTRMQRVKKYDEVFAELAKMKKRTQHIMGCAIQDVQTVMRGVIAFGLKGSFTSPLNVK